MCGAGFCAALLSLGALPPCTVLGGPVLPCGAVVSCPAALFVFLCVLFYCWRYLKNANRFYWRLMGLCHANPPSSQLSKLLTKIALGGGRVVLCTPDWGTGGEHAYWRRLLDRMTVGSIELPNGPIYLFEDCQETMPATEWGNFLSIVDGSVNPLPVSDLDQVVLKELMAPDGAFTLLGLKERSEYSSVTTTSDECSDEQETPPVSTPLVDADDHRSEIDSAIPPVSPEVLTLKDSAFPAQLLLDEVGLADSGRNGSHDHTVFSMRALEYARRPSPPL